MNSKTVSRYDRGLFAAVDSVSLAGAAVNAAHAASEIKIVVNKQAITSVDLARRTAFLRLQRQKGNLQQKAREQLTEEALKMQEARRVGAVIPDSQVEASFQRFASNNKMSTKQLTQVLAQAGVTAGHFKDYIRVQMTWPRMVQARYGSEGSSTQDLVAKMLESGESKPSTTEYILHQVIFVVPQSKRSGAYLGARAPAPASGRLEGGDRGHKQRRHHQVAQDRSRHRVHRRVFSQDRVRRRGGGNGLPGGRRRWRLRQRRRRKVSGRTALARRHFQPLTPEFR